MAYNPFDDVIENDPAYQMQTGGVQPMVIPQRRTDYSAQETFKPIATSIARAYKLLTPEQETLDQIEKDQQLRSLATAQAFKGTEFEKFAGDFDLPSEVLTDRKAMDLLDQAGFKRESFTEGFSRIGQFLYGNQRKAFEKLRDGEQLTSDDRLSIALAPLDTLDFLLPPVAIKKLAGLGLKNVNSILKSTSDLPEVQQVKQFFGGSPVPAIGGRADGPPGMVTEPRITLAKEDGTGAGAPSLYPDPPSKIGSSEFRQWRTNTAKTLFEELRKQKGDPNYKFTKTEAIDELLNLFNTKFSNLPESNRTRTAMMSILQGREGGKITRPLDEFLITGTEGGTSPQYFQQFADKNKDLPGTPTYKYLTSMVKKFEQENGFKPTSLEIAKYIQRTGDDEAKSFFAIKDTASAKKKGETGQINAVIDQNRKQGTEGVDDLLQPSKSKEIARFIESKSKSDPFFKSQYDIAIANLNKTDAKFNTIKAQYNILVDQFKDSLGNPPFSYTQFTKYLRENKLIPKRTLSLEQVSYPPQIGASKDVTNAKETVSSMLISTDDSLDYKKYAIGLGIDDDMFRFLQHKYRSLVEDTDKKTLLPADKYIEQYVMPYKGATKKETIRNLENAYPEFKTTWQPMEDTFKVYEDYLNVKMEELAASGKYTDQQLNEIRKSLAPNRSHNFEVKRANLQDRMINASAAGQFIQIQPFYINNSLQPIYDNLLRRIFDDLETAPNINTLKDKKIKNIELSKNKQDYSGVKTSVSEYKELFPDKSKHNQYDYLNYLYKQANEQMKDKGIVSYQVFNPKNKNIIQGYEVRKGELGDFLVVGSKGTYTPQQYIDRALKQIEAGGLPGKFNPKNPKSALRFKKRGGVQMAIGGQNFTENMNQQQFTPDPGIEGMSAFEQAVQSGNLQAVNFPKIFQSLGKTLGVFTPNKAKVKTDVPTGTTALVGDEALSSFDFPFVSFTLDKIQKSQTKAAKPQDWINELQGGKDKAPSAELLDSGLFQYLADFEKYYPNQKIPKEKLIETYESNPITNLQVKIKGADTGDAALDSYMGKPRHQNTGSARIDNAGQDYREVVLEAGPLPGEKNPFVNSSHFNEKNVIGFSRVATYKNSQGDNVAVIQELQTDLLTKIRNEQERLDAQIEVLTRRKNKAEETLANPQSDNYDKSTAQDSLNLINNELPKLLELKKSNLIRPYPNVAAEELIPGLNKKLQDIQKNINTLSMQGARRENPEFLMMISRLEDEQKMVLNQLLDLNRSSNYQLAAQGVKVPDLRDRDELLNYIQGNNRYPNMKDIETFPPTPFNKQGDYVDLIIKATIKDAENRGINKIAIIPADIGPNTRWGKDSEEAKKKFRNLYDKVAVQQLNNIAKKYGGSVQVEQIVDSGRGELGLRFLNKGVDGEFQVLKETDIDPSVTIRREDLGPTKPPEGLNAFLNEEILRVAKDYGPNEVVFRREIAPGQTMEYFVNVRSGDVVDQKFDLVPLGDADSARDATIIIEEYNPQLVDMVTLTLPDSNKGKPMFLFKKKKGGIMPDDRLVSITDIYGDY